MNYVVREINFYLIYEAHFITFILFQESSCLYRRIYIIENVDLKISNIERGFIIYKYLNIR